MKKRHVDAWIDTRHQLCRLAPFLSSWVSKMRLLFFGIIFLTAGYLPYDSVQAGLPDTIDKIRPSIVAIGTYQSIRQQPLMLVGTGFIVADGRHVVTNYHVVSKELATAKNEYLVVLIGHGKKVKQFRLRKVVVDQEHDLALLAFDGPAHEPLRLDLTKKVREGQRYAFTGYPITPILGLYPVTHRAIISALTPMVAPMNNSKMLTAKQIIKLRSNAYNVYQLDANAYPGNSGSPVFDPDTGGVVAILNSVYVKQYRENALMHPSGISYAIPVKYANRLLLHPKE